jgi:Methylamine utilisation protein MauE
MLAELCFAVQLAIGLVFLTSAAGKLSDPKGFARGVADYQIVPKSMTGTVSLMIVACEIWLSVTHLTVFANTINFVLGLGTLSTFAFAVTVNLARGRALPCHCFGGGGDTISTRTLARLALLASGEIFLIVTKQFRHYPEQITRPPDVFLALFWAVLLILAGLWFLSLGDVFELLRDIPSLAHRKASKNWALLQDETKRVAQG